MAQRQIGKATDTLSYLSERLSSGQRINRASDDAAGLAIASNLDVRARIYNQSIRNVNDYISALSIATGAAEAISGSLTRMQELAEQAANGTYSAIQRQVMDREAEELRKEINRIVETTSFQGVKLLDGSFSNSVAQIGEARAVDNISISIGNVLGTLRPNGNFVTSGTYAPSVSSPGPIASGDFNGDGTLDLAIGGASPSGSGGMVSIMFGNGDGTFSIASTLFDNGNSSVYNLTVSDLNNDGVSDIIASRFNSSGGSAQQTEIFIGNGNGTFQYRQNIVTNYTSLARQIAVGDVNGDGVVDLGIGSQDQGTYGILLGNGDGSFRAIVNYALPSSQSRSPVFADVNRDGKLDVLIGSNGSALHVALGNGNGTFQVATTYASGVSPFRQIDVADLNGDGYLDVVGGGGNGTAVWLGNADGTFKASTSYAIGAANAVKIWDFDDDGRKDFVVTVGTAYEVMLNNGDGTFRAGVSIAAALGNGLAVDDVTGDRVKDLIMAGSGSTYVVATGQGRAGVAPLDLTTQSAARLSLTYLNNARETFSRNLGGVGAQESRLQYVQSVLATLREQYRASSSRIMDADVAETTAQYTAARILQEAAAVVLGQANSQPEIALQLLKAT